MEIIVTRGDSPTRGRVTWGRNHAPCALGRAGIALIKREGDGATPMGRFALRRLFYRADRRTRPETALPTSPITPNLGWCDDPTSPAYNRLVRLPCPWRHEVLARADGVYDLVVVLGHNDAPPEPGAGSAIFLHLATPDLAPTEGCVALADADLADLLRAARPGDVMTVKG
ncbi:MAG: L,D-transpeptidase family protein [Rhodospirillales bacterium]|tara:strand:+ start:254 stop:766 length:513 start_codon:yes stop_codon:yes gene_type:complete